MIGWRYHLISIVAVFLALGLGLLMGTALLNDRLVETLRNRTENAQARLTERQQQVATFTEFVRQVLPFVAEDRLFGQQVVVVTYEGADEEALADAREALDLAGADVQAALSLQSGLMAASPAEQRNLSEILTIPEGASRSEIASTAFSALAERLSDGAESAPPEDDVLARLLSEGFIVAVDPETDTAEGIGGLGQAVVFVTGGDGTGPSADILMPLIQQLSQTGTVLAVGERTTSEEGVIGRVRENVDPAGPLVTVDDIDLPAGTAALVLGLERAIDTGESGDYGVGEGAQLLPAAA
jgi:hypothetical protein